MAGSQNVQNAIDLLNQITTLMGAGVPLIQMGRTAYALLKGLTKGLPQATLEQAQEAMAKWDAAESVAIERNQSWLDTHPRTDE